MSPALADFAHRLLDQIQAPGAGALNFPEAAIELFRLQFEANAAYRKLCKVRGREPDQVRDWTDIPPVPTIAFKDLEMTAIAPPERSAVFHSSGTSGHEPSRHYHTLTSLELYEVSAFSWFRTRLLDGFNEFPEPHWISLTPPPEQAVHSSLVHMITSVARRARVAPLVFAGRISPEGWTINDQQLWSGVAGAEKQGAPVFLLGTAFSFVHLLDSLRERRQRIHFREGSRIMETGGYKGRSRDIPKAELHEEITRVLGIPNSHIVSEYGMSELSSQAYDKVWTRHPAEGRAHARRRLQFPPWARYSVISPETGRAVPPGEVGLLRVWDLANVWSVMTIQTEDMAVDLGGGFDLRGRTPKAEPRGCSLMAA
jgi:hypothetical protein